MVAASSGSDVMVLVEEEGLVVDQLEVGLLPCLDQKCDLESSCFAQKYDSSRCSTAGFVAHLFRVRVSFCYQVSSVVVVVRH